MIWALLPLVASLTGQGLSVAKPAADSESLARIRQALSQQNPVQIRIIEPTFRVAIRERMWDRVWDKPTPWQNPAPPGGLHAFEQRQLLGNPWANQPLVQIDILPIAEWMIQSVKDAGRAHNERAAHEEVLRSLAAFCVTNVCEVAR